MTNEGDPMTTHMADCRVSYCPGCVAPDVPDPYAETPEIRALAAEVAARRAALVAAGHRIVPKTFELELPTPTREEDR